MTHPFHDEMIAAGWVYYGKQGDFKPFGYYCLKTEGLPDCHCNNKPPHVSAEPYNLHYKYPDAPNVWNFELSITGECANDEWVWLKTQTYQRPLAEWTTLINRLKVAWTATEGVK